METKEFRDEFEQASNDLTRGFNVLRSSFANSYQDVLKSLVDYGRKIPLEQLRPLHCLPVLM